MDRRWMHKNIYQLHKYIYQLHKWLETRAKRREESNTLSAKPFVKSFKSFKYASVEKERKTLAWSLKTAVSIFYLLFRQWVHWCKRQALIYKSGENVMPFSPKGIIYPIFSLDHRFKICDTDLKVERKFKTLFRGFVSQLYRSNILAFKMADTI